MKVITKKEQGVLIAHPVGELDHHGAEIAREHLKIAARECGAGNLILDLTEVGFMDSSGVGVILGVHKTVTDLGGRLMVVPGVGARKLLELSGILTLIPSYRSVEEAKRGVNA